MKASASRTDGVAERQPKGLGDGFAQGKASASRTDGVAERTRAIVLCADDFAVHEAASIGIAQLARRGRLSATSVMVLSPRWAQDASLLQDLRGRIDVGLHLDWTSDFALTAGHGRSLNAAMVKALLGGFNSVAARAVIERQLDAFERHWKAPPDHIDGHQHVQQFAGIREALVQAITARYGAQPPYLRISQAPPGLMRFKSRVIAGLGAKALRRLADAAHIACAPVLSGIYDFKGGSTRYAALMAQWLSLADGDLVMCHPAQGVEAGDEIGAARAWEFEFLASQAFGDLLSQQQVQLARGAGHYTAAR
jgi:predicted glycoside hydrolase/deacetylase ChbG (UPF0249 family)